jgi:hypothetical protein
VRKKMSEKAKKKKKGNEAEMLAELKPVADALTPWAKKFSDPRLAKTVTFIRWGYSKGLSGILGGYSESYAKSGLSSVLRDSKKMAALAEEISREMPDLYRGWARLP